MNDLIDRTIGDRCIMLIEMEWQREANDDPRENAPCGWFRPADQFMFKPAEGAPGVHGIAPLEALPRILAALEPVAALKGADHE